MPGAGLIDAVLFDFGGVFTLSPFEAVRGAAEALGVDGEAAVTFCFGPYDRDTGHAWHRMERGELSLADTRAELLLLAASEGHGLDPFELLRATGGDDPQREPMVERALALVAQGYRTAAVTNNVKEFGTGWRAMVPVDELFEVIIDSSAVGVRKPDPRIYHLALDALGGIVPERAVLLDDAPGNIASARAIGMHAVLVGADRLAAMDELEALLEGRL
jgi:epoxide hydrolase-like predicted phosphatase